MRPAKSTHKRIGEFRAARNRLTSSRGNFEVRGIDPQARGGVLNRAESTHERMEEFCTPQNRRISVRGTFGRRGIDSRSREGLSDDAKLTRRSGWELFGRGIGGRACRLPELPPRFGLRRPQGGSTGEAHRPPECHRRECDFARGRRRRMQFDFHVLAFFALGVPVFPSSTESCPVRTAMGIAGRFRVYCCLVVFHNDSIISSNQFSRIRRCRQTRDHRLFHSSNEPALQGRREPGLALQGRSPNGQPPPTHDAHATDSS